MKRSVKVILVCCLFVLGTVALAGCSSEKRSQEQMPPDTDLEFWITQNVENTDWSEHDEIFGWMGAHEYLGSAYEKSTNEDGVDIRPTHRVSYVVTAWPDYADGGSFITDISVTDPKVRVRGLTVQSSFEDFDAVFKPLGYSLSWNDGAIKTRVAEKDGITYRLTPADPSAPDVTPLLRITAEITNRQGIIY